MVKTHELELRYSFPYIKQKFAMCRDNVVTGGIFACRVLMALNPTCHYAFPC